MMDIRGWEGKSRLLVINSEINQLYFFSFELNKKINHQLKVVIFFYN
jgi:hypothetical protein